MSDQPKDSRRRLAKLNDDGEQNDYAHWIIKAKLKLRSLELWKYIEGPDSTPPVIPALVPTVTRQAKSTATNTMIEIRDEGNESIVNLAKKVAEPWLAGDLAALELIVEAVPTQKVAVVALCEHAKDAWKALADEYMPINRQRARHLYQAIMAYRCPTGRVLVWIDNIRELYFKLCNQDSTSMSDTVFAHTIVNLLPNEDPWITFTNTLREKMLTADNDGKPLTLSTVFQLIREQQWSTDSNDPNSVDRLLGKRSASPTPVINAAGSQPFKRNRFDLRCSNKYCERPIGHTIENCFAYEGGKVGQYADWFKGPRNIHLPPHQRTAVPTGNRGLNYNGALPAANNAMTTPTVDNKANVTVNAVSIESRNTYQPNAANNANDVSLTQGGFIALNTFLDPASNISCNKVALTSD